MTTMIDPGGAEFWYSSRALVDDLLGAGYVAGGDAPYLCVRAQNAGVITDGSESVGWALAPGITRKRARVILKMLLLAMPKPDW